MESQDDLRNKIIECYEIIFEYFKKEDWFIDSNHFDQVLKQLDSLFKSNDLLKIDFWFRFIDGDEDQNPIKLLGYPNFEYYYFRHTVLKIFNKFILNKEKFVHENLAILSPEYSEICGAGLLNSLDEYNQTEQVFLDDLNNAYAHFEKTEFLEFDFSLSTLDEIFNPFLSKSKKNEERKTYIKRIEYLLENNHFFRAMRNLDFHRMIGVIDKFDDEKLIFIQYKNKLSDFKVQIPMKKLVKKYSGRGFRIKSEFRTKLDKIYRLIANDYILQPETGDKKKLFDKIFNGKKSDYINEWVNMVSDDVWLMPYIIKELKKLEAFIYPAQKHWEVFNLCFRRNGEFYTENQLHKITAPKGKDAVLRNELDSILEINQTTN